MAGNLAPAGFVALPRAEHSPHGFGHKDAGESPLAEVRRRAGRVVAENGWFPSGRGGWNPVQEGDPPPTIAASGTGCPWGSPRGAGAGGPAAPKVRHRLLLQVQQPP